MNCDKVGCDHRAKFRIGGDAHGYNTCGRHVAYYAQHMSGPSVNEWVPIAPVWHPAESASGTEKTAT